MHTRIVRMRDGLIERDYKNENITTAEAVAKIRGFAVASPFPQHLNDKFFKNPFSFKNIIYFCLCTVPSTYHSSVFCVTLKKMTSILSIQVCIQP